MRDDWITPKELYRDLDREFHFNDDPCPIDAVGLFRRGLERAWGTSTFVNPPYSRPAPWINKAIEEARAGKSVVMLLKSDTSTSWFHDLVLPNAEIRWIKGRLQYTAARGSQSRNNFPSMLAIFRPPAAGTLVGARPLVPSTGLSAYEAAE